jgi:hypothetical protein
VAPDRRRPRCAEAPGRILFIDGVRRIDARVWIEDAEGDIYPGLCASYAAGAVCCDERAEVIAAEVGRGRVLDRADRGRHRCVEGHLSRAHGRVIRCRRAHARGARTHGADRGRHRGEGSGRRVDRLDRDRRPVARSSTLAGAIGFIKSHAVAYLPPELHRMVGKLASGQRTPVFTIGTTWSRHAWYLRLPGPEGSPWAGIVRCECSSDLAPEAAIALANQASAALPRFASEAHKDTRAPQNLYPIAGLERELRRRFGDQALLYRSLRQVARASA